MYQKKMGYMRGLLCCEEDCTDHSLRHLLRGRQHPEIGKKYKEEMRGKCPWRLAIRQLCL